MKRSEMMIISNLRNNARQSLTRMGRKTSIPISTIYEKIRCYEEGIIKKYTVIVDFGKLGFATRVSMLLKTTKEKRDELKNFLLENKSINNVYKINNEYDFVVEGFFRELKDVEAFLDKIENSFGVSDKRLFYIVDDIKNEGFMSNPEAVMYDE